MSMPVAGEIAFVVVNVFILLLEFMKYGNEG